MVERTAPSAARRGARQSPNQRFDALGLARTWSVRALAVLLGDVILSYIVLAGGLFFALALALFLLHGAPFVVFGAILAPGWAACALLGRTAMQLPFSLWRDAKPKDGGGKFPTARLSPAP